MTFFEPNRAPVLTRRIPSEFAPMAVPCLVGNSAAHPWVVQKFGGTSVGKFPDKVGFDLLSLYRGFLRLPCE